MGKKGDPKAVVDSEGLVFGIDGLRIVDASVLPFTPPGHPQSVVCESPAREVSSPALAFRLGENASAKMFR